jgi:hypothetical protein
MKDQIRKSVTAVKNHVKRQKFAYGFAALATLAIYGNLRTSKHIGEFLKEKGIDPFEFSCPELFEEIKNPIS